MALTFEPIAIPLHCDESGTVRVSRTRVTLDTILTAYKAGESPERMAEAFPSVPLADIYATIAWYLEHREQVDSYLQKRAEDGAAWRSFWESRYDKQAIREQLLARRATMETGQRAAADRG
jgi:uncharacterized protein (DUF433 family)